MSRNQKPARIEILPNHVACLRPFFPELQEQLINPVVEFSASGPFGHAVEPIDIDRFVEKRREWHFHKKSQKCESIPVQRLPLGRIPAVLEWSENQGYDVELHDLRSDSPNWCIEHDWRKRIPRKLHATMVAVAAHRALRLIGSHTESIADICLAIARSYPSARIAIGVGTHRQLRRIDCAIHSKANHLGFTPRSGNDRLAFPWGSFDSCPAGTMASSIFSYFRSHTRQSVTRHWNGSFPDSFGGF